MKSEIHVFFTCLWIRSPNLNYPTSGMTWLRYIPRTWLFLLIAVVWERDRERIPLLLSHSPNDFSCLSWAKGKQGTRAITWLSLWVAGAKYAQLHHLPLPQGLKSRTELEVEPQRLFEGLWHGTLASPLNLQCHNTNQETTF